MTALPEPRTLLRQAIVASDRSAWQIAHLANVSPTQLSLIGSGRRPIKRSEAVRIAKALRTSIGALFPDEAFADERGGRGRRLREQAA